MLKMFKIKKCKSFKCVLHFPNKNQTDGYIIEPIVLKVNQENIQLVMSGLR